MGTASFQTWGKLLLSRGARKIHVCVLLLRFGGAVIGGSDFKSHRLGWVSFCLFLAVCHVTSLRPSFLTKIWVMTLPIFFIEPVGGLYRHLI